MVSTVPWDSYLVRRGIWTYPPEAVLGPVFFAIPIEELFFFVIQTYTTTVLYLLVTKPVLQAAYLVPDPPSTSASPDKSRLSQTWTRILGQSLLALVIVAAAAMVFNNGRATYLGLILVWIAPFVLLLWCACSQGIERCRRDESDPGQEPHTPISHGASVVEYRHSHHGTDPLSVVH